MFRCTLNVNYLLFSAEDAKQKTGNINSEYNIIAQWGKEFC